jgi:acyl carrier protein
MPKNRAGQQNFELESFMANVEKYKQAFVDTFGVNEGSLENLKYQSVEAWDSVGHMGLITALEEKFNIMLDTDDIIDFSSYEAGLTILRKYNVEL